MKLAILTTLAIACSACASTPPTASPAAPPAATSRVPAHAQGALKIALPASAPQASLVFGKAPADSLIVYDGRTFHAASDGTFVFGLARTQTGQATLHITAADGRTATVSIAITPRAFRTEVINGVPEKTVKPPPEIAAHIEREQAQVNAARSRDDDRTDFEQRFIWPVKGRISGVFGSQRIYNGTPGAAHSGVDIATAKGTPIVAPAGGIVTFANADLYLTGGTVLIDHGHGVSSNFLHMSRIDVKVGQRVEQGQTIGLVGATGRATGPHMHWGMNWFDVRIDPQALLESENPKPAESSSH